MARDFDLVWNGYTVCPEVWGMTDVCEIFHRVYYVYGGEASYTYKGETVPLLPGRIYIFPVFRRYSMRHNPEKPLDVLWFHVVMKMNIRLSEDIRWIEVEPGTGLSHLLEALRLFSNRSECYDHLLGLFAVLVAILEEGALPTPDIGREMLRVQSFIEESGGEPPDVEALARYANMDRSHFCRKFKRVFRTSPSRYITGVRMKRATRALLSGSTVYAAARACGYSDEKAFSRAFKRYMEIPPGQYRDERMIYP